MKKTPYYLLSIIILIILWTLLSIILTPYIVPYPVDTIIKFFVLLTDQSTLYSAFTTIIRTLTGFLLAFVIGFFIGLLSGSFKKAEYLSFIPTIILQGAPPMLWVIPLMLIFGTGNTSPTLVVFFVTLPLVILNIQEGRKSINADMFSMFKIYANSKIMIFKELIIPSLSPYIKTILILGIVLAFKSSIIGEWFGARTGLGRRINEYFYTFNMLSFYATSLLLLLIVGISGYLSKKAGNLFFSIKKKSIIVKNKPEIPADYFKSSNTCIDLKNINFNYGNKVILKNADFNICPGETAVLTGDSGIGKTTFAKILTGILKPNNKEINLPKNPGFIFQDDALLPHLDCFGNASLPAKWKNIKDYESITLYFLKLCGLEQSTFLFPEELSGGMKKRLSFARSLVLNPDYMILDEPFNNLQKDARIELWNLYFELFTNRGIPSLIITHYPEELENRNAKYYKIMDKKIIEI